MTRAPLGWVRRRDEALILAGIALLSAAVRLALLQRSHWMVDGDEAMVGLMAKHIMEGQRPIFLAGQAYAGALHAYEAALLFGVLGMSRIALKLVPAIASLAFVVTTYWLARRLLSPRAAAVAGIVAAVPPVYVAVNTLKAWAPYTEVIVLGNVMLALTAGLAWGTQQRRGTVFALGVVAGIAFWLQPIAACYIITCGIVLLAKLRAKVGRLAVPIAAGFALGGTPLWIGNLAGDFGTFRYLAQGHPMGQDTGAIAGYFLQSLLPRVLGLSQPWGETPPVAAWGLGVLLAAAALALAMRGRRTHGRDLAPGHVPLLLAAVVALVFVLSGFGGPSLNRWGFDATGRYAVPLWSGVPLAVAALAEAVRRPRVPLATAVAGLVVAAHVVGYAAADPAKTFQSPYWNKLPPSNEELLGYLRGNGIGEVWLNHWAGLPLTFDAQESIVAADYYDVFVAGGINRFPEHFARVERAERPAYVLVTDEAEPALEARLRTMGVEYDKARVGPYVVIRPLSRRVAPAEVGDAIDYRY